MVTTHKSEMSVNISYLSCSPVDPDFDMIMVKIPLDKKNKVAYINYGFSEVKGL